MYAIRSYYEDVHRAGGVLGILAELDRGGLVNRDIPTVHHDTMGDALSQWDIMTSADPQTRTRYLAAPGNVPTLEASYNFV